MPQNSVAVLKSHLLQNAVAAWETGQVIPVPQGGEEMALVDLSAQTSDWLLYPWPLQQLLLLNITESSQHVSFEANLASLFS